MILADLLPVPASVNITGETLELNKTGALQAEAGTDFIVANIQEIFKTFGLKPNIKLELASQRGAEAWEIIIDPARITLSGGDRAGLFYGAGALKQLLALACARGVKKAQIPCGVISDAPRFHRRGFMLDSARHFQPVARIKEVIRLMAEMRLNHFHWHLTDDQAWRYQSDCAPKLTDASTEFYSKDELREITAYAAEHFITITPEIEMPGHSHGILTHYPELGCDPSKPGSMFCLGSAKTKQFLQMLILELIEIFPNSPTIHLGGDEASTAPWEACSRCQAAMKELSLTNVRELESVFMRDMCGFVLEQKRTPIVWSTHSVMQPEVIVQIWRSLHELESTYRHGNQIVNSVDCNYYLDYPADGSDFKYNWMLTLPEEAVYLAEPYFHQEQLVGSKLLGPEACLWTEIVPEWRVMSKLKDRLFAFAETAWSLTEKREWHDYSRRKSCLRNAGYFELI